MDGILDPHAHYNASSLVLVVADLLAATVMWHWAHGIMIERGIRCRDFFLAPTVRMVVGAIICLIGIAVGSIMWLPAFPLIISGNVTLADWYVRVATWPANIANMLSVVGMSIIMWPMLKAKFGPWAIPTVISVTLAVYVFGIVGSLLVGQWLAP